MSHRYVRKRKCQITYIVHQNGRKRKVTKSYKPCSSDTISELEQEDVVPVTDVVKAPIDTANSSLALEEIPGSSNTQRNMHIDIVIKFGGSAITEKDKLETLRDAELLHACSNVRKFVNEGKRVIVVHGAGSFGHHQAKQYKVNDGYRNSKDQGDTKYGFCLTRVSVTKLNNLVVESLCNQGVNAVGIQSFGFWKTDNRAVIQDNINVIQEIMENGLVPVLHGDCVFDNERGCCILSGDTIIKVLCQRLEIPTILFLTDVNGIYTKDPKEEGASLIPRIEMDRHGKTVTNFTTSSLDCDVTGGIDLKIRTAKDIVTSSNGKSRVLVCNVKDDVYKVVCSCDLFKGTTIMLA